MGRPSYAVLAERDNEPDTSIAYARADGFIGHCGSNGCGGPTVSAGRSGRIFWVECLVCGRATGIQVTR